MKTAMQLLLEILESKILPCDDDNSYVYGMNVAHANLIYNIKNGFIEKEKEQIIDAHLEGWSDAYDYIYSDSNQQARQAEDYYNQTYNK
ncbi:hypothetical protein UFOVP198_33 [uncultured Caudovirales phage]|uniref:Uncharacterized protein n=1 Tax=uncultured Caudovirales phage TaxID=2100421 RepID=A0A6J7WLE2_9CAUD|nr:hypothetical protein UFOVP198_33 [uncultured Caudovirales phage]